MLGVLQIVLSQYRIARRLGVTRKLHVLFSNMRGIAANLDVRTGRLEAASQGVLTLAVAVTAAALIMVATLTVVGIRTATASAILLSLPHGLPFSITVESFVAFYADIFWAYRTCPAKSEVHILPTLTTAGTVTMLKPICNCTSHTIKSAVRHRLNCGLNLFGH